MSSHSLSVVVKSDNMYGRISGSGSEDVDGVSIGIKRLDKYSRLTGRKDWTRGARISAEKAFRKASAAERSSEVGGTCMGHIEKETAPSCVVEDERKAQMEQDE